MNNEETIQQLKEDNDRLRLAAEQSQRKYNELYITHREFMDLHEGGIIKTLHSNLEISVVNSRLSQENELLRDEIKWIEERSRHRFRKWLKYNWFIRKTILFFKGLFAKLK